MSDGGKRMVAVTATEVRVGTGRVALGSALDDCERREKERPS